MPSQPQFDIPSTPDPLDPTKTSQSTQRSNVLEYHRQSTNIHNADPIGPHPLHRPAGHRNRAEHVRILSLSCISISFRTHPSTSPFPSPTLISLPFPSPSPTYPPTHPPPSPFPPSLPQLPLTPRSPRAAAPEPAGCNGGSYRDPDKATAEALCKSHCLDSCITFQNQDYWYSVCQCVCHLPTSPFLPILAGS